MKEKSITGYYKNPRTDLIKAIQDQDIHPKKILEIGGGEFVTLDFLGKKYHAEIYGTDIYEPANKNINFIHGSIEDEETLAKINNNFFDLIIIADTLEHLKNPEKALKNIKEKLTTTGIIIMSIPNIRQVRTLYYIFLRGTFPKDEAGLFDKTHLRWFCKKDMIEMITSNGYNLKSIEPTGRLINIFTKKNILAEFLALQYIAIASKT